MKKILFSLLAFIITSVVFAQKKADDVAKFSTETFDFGKVKQNVAATATFIVTNTGAEPLIIQTASASCGCTASDYTQTPIAPGKTGYIKAVFNSVALGGIDKSVTVKFAGIDETKTIKLAGEVLEPAAYDTWAATNKTDNKTSVKVKDDKVKTETKTSTGTTKVKTKKGKKVVEKSIVKK